jgi:hypothetical protein
VFDDRALYVDGPVNGRLIIDDAETARRVIGIVVVVLIILLATTADILLVMLHPLFAKVPIDVLLCHVQVIHSSSDILVTVAAGK